MNARTDYAKRRAARHAAERIERQELHCHACQRYVQFAHVGRLF